MHRKCEKYVHLNAFEESVLTKPNSDGFLWQVGAALESGIE
jgi:hypothetical protein